MNIKVLKETDLKKKKPEMIQVYAAYLNVKNMAFQNSEFQNNKLPNKYW